MKQMPKDLEAIIEKEMEELKLNLLTEVFGDI